MGLLIWIVVLGMAAQITKFWPRGLYLILGTTAVIMILSVGSAANDRLGEHRDIWNPTLLAFNVLVKFITTSIVVGIGYAIGAAYRWRESRKTTQKSGE